MSGKAIVLDANILIRAVMGKRVRELIFDNVTKGKFFAPDVAYAYSGQRDRSFWSIVTDFRAVPESVVTMPEYLVTIPEWHRIPQ